MNRHRIAVIELNDKKEQKKEIPLLGTKLKACPRYAHMCAKNKNKFAHFS